MGTTVNVATTDQLQDALETAYTDPGRVIQIEPGAYSWKGYAMALLGPPNKDKPVRGLTVKGMGDHPTDVRIFGDSMDSGVGRACGYSFILANAQDIWFENFALENCKAHHIALKGEYGLVRNVTVRNCALVDAGEQFIKGTASKEEGLGAVNVAVEGCYFGYRLRPFVDRNKQQGGGLILERLEPRVIRLKLSPGSLDRTSYPINYWVGAAVDFPDARSVTGTVVASEPWDVQESHQLLALDIDVPAEATRISLLLDGPDIIIPDAWGPMGGYSGAIDLHMATNTRVTGCDFQRIGTNLVSHYGHAVPAVYLWGGSQDSVVEDCAFLDCEQGIALGLGNKTTVVPVQHRRGLVRNIQFYRNEGVRGDRGIGFDTSPDNLTHDVAIILNNTYPNAVEYRFKETTNSTLVRLETDARNPVALRPPDVTPEPVTCGITAASYPEDVLDAVESRMDRWGY